VTWSILEGDCIDVMRTLPAESVDAIITSPPYAMQRKATYGGVPEPEYPAWTVAWMAEARRLLKPDGNVVINIRPHIRHGQLSDYTLRTRLALREAGWVEVEELIWHKRGAMPTGSPRRPRRSWESLHWFAKHGRSWADPKAAGTAPVRSDATWVNRAVRNGWDHGIRGSMTSPEIARVTNVLTLSAKHGGGFDHPAPYPPALAEWVGKLICPPGGTILDPFSGSASTGVACIRNGWDYIGIEAMPEYAEMSRRRLEQTAA
jgi:site-specific DNA-methyltransferase (adenine-specific)